MNREHSGARGVSSWSRRHLAPVKGRGAASARLSARFGLPARVADGDWRDAEGAIDGAPDRPRTTVTVEHPKRIINRVTSPDLPFDRSINLYRGCEHGCIYCYARPTHAYYDLSPGLDFETKLFAKPDAPALLRRELAAPGYVAWPIAIGTNTDPYQPIERVWRLTRQTLEILLETRHPVIITTKSDRLLRDLDLLEELAKLSLVSVTISVTTLDPETARSMEPRAPHPEKRLAAVATLAAHGVPVFVNMAPVVPQITDHEIEAVVARAAEAGAWDVRYIPLRLPHEVAPLFREWLDVHFPDRAQKVMATVQSLRGGRDNDPAFFRRMRGEGVWAALLARRVAVARRRHGLGRKRVRLRCDLFCPPIVAGHQFALF